MIKSVFAATAALSMSAGAALAGPYVNVETNAGLEMTGDDSTPKEKLVLLPTTSTTDIHVH